MAFGIPELHISVEYCAAWKHTPRAVSLTTEIFAERELEYFIADWKMIPGSGGIFDVHINDELVFSKKAMGRHPEPGEIKAIIQEKIVAIKQAKGLTWETIPEN